MATEILLKDLTAEKAASFEDGETIYVRFDDEPASDYLMLDWSIGMPGMNGIPVYALAFWLHTGDGIDGEPDHMPQGLEHFLTHEHATDALMQRAKSSDPLLHSSLEVRRKLVETVKRSFVHTLDQSTVAPYELSAKLLGLNLSADVDQRRYELIDRFLKESDEVCAEAYVAVLFENETVELPVRKWLELNVAFAALRFLSHTLQGHEPTWEEIWDGTGLGSTEFIFASNDLLSQNPSKGAADEMVSIRAELVQIAFLHMTRMSIDIQKHLAAKQAA